MTCPGTLRRLLKGTPVFLCAPSGNHVKIIGKEPLGKFVWRSRFDKALVEWAHDKGAETRELTRVSDLIIKSCVAWSQSPKAGPRK